MALLLVGGMGSIGRWSVSIDLYNYTEKQYGRKARVVNLSVRFGLERNPNPDIYKLLGHAHVLVWILVDTVSQ
jgi:hypothetical protein